MSGIEFHFHNKGTLVTDGHTDTLVITPAQLDSADKTTNDSGRRRPVDYSSELVQTRLFCAAAAVVATIAGYAVLFPVF